MGTLRKREKKKTHLIGWDKITKSKKEGGIGIKTNCLQNAAFMSKLRWDLQINTPKPWVTLGKIITTPLLNYHQISHPSFIRVFLKIWISSIQIFPTLIEMV